MRAATVVSFVVLSTTVAAQHGSSPGVRIDQTTQGAKLFRAQCAGCHGPDGSGTGAGPALNSGSFRHGNSDDAIVATISKGVSGTTMPSFSYDAGQMWQLVAHIRSLALVHAATGTVGDVEAGAELFRANCAGCHTPLGAFTGPDLTQAGARLSVPQLRQSIVDPNAAVPSDHWSVSARTTSGETITGIRLNEDTRSIQLRDRAGKLKSILKKDLAGYDIVRTSPMPSFKDKLSQTEIDNVIAYIMKGAQ